MDWLVGWLVEDRGWFTATDISCNESVTTQPTRLPPFIRLTRLCASVFCFTTSLLGKQEDAKDVATLLNWREFQCPFSETVWVTDLSSSSKSLSSHELTRLMCVSVLVASCTRIMVRIVESATL